MAMGNCCYHGGIECPYATFLGKCRYEDDGRCVMYGDKMPDEKK